MREFLKGVAIITMTIDHIGFILYPEFKFLRIIGRLSFPIFCYLLVLGTESTRNARNYILRLLIFALISQVPYHLAFGFEPIEQLNIFFTLALGVLTIILYTKRSVLILLPILAAFLNFEGSIYGIAVVVFMTLLKDDKRLGILALLLLNVLFYPFSNIQIFSLFALPIIILHISGFLKMESVHVREDSIFYSMKKYLFYAYYPLHLTALYLIKLYFY